MDFDPTKVRLSREVWKPVPGFDRRYQVSNLGRIRSHTIGRYGNTRITYLRGTVTVHGYRQVTLYDNDDVMRVVRLCRIVAEAFKGRCLEGKEVRHLDGNRLNDVETNLEYGTHQENEDDKLLHGTRPRGETHGCSVLDEDDVLDIRIRLACGERVCDVAALYGINQAHVSRIKLRKSWRHI